MCSQSSSPAHNQNGVLMLCDSEFGGYHHAGAGAAKLFRPSAKYALDLSLSSSGTEYPHKGCGFVDARTAASSYRWLLVAAAYDRVILPALSMDRKD
jgi:hypothetical protein